MHSETCTLPPSLRVLTFAGHTRCLTPPFAQGTLLAERGLLYCRWPFLVGFAVTGGIFFNIARGLTGAPAQAGAPCRQPELQPWDMVLTLVCLGRGRGRSQEIKCVPGLLLTCFPASLLLAGTVGDAVCCALQSSRTPARRACPKTLRHTRARAAYVWSAAGQRVPSRCAARVAARRGAGCVWCSKECVHSAKLAEQLIGCRA